MIAANDNEPAGERAIHPPGLHPFPRFHGDTLEEAANRFRETSRQGGGRFRAPSIETPFDKACRDGRINVDLALTAGFVEMAFEKSSRRGGIPVATAGNPMAIGYSSDPLRPVGPEITADARRELWDYEAAAGDCWKGVCMAIMGRSTMRDIGLAYGAPIRRAARHGLGVVVDGLQRIDRAWWEMEAANDNTVVQLPAYMIG